MPTQKQIQPGEKVPLKLTATERKLVLEDVTCLHTGYEQIIRNTPSGKPVMMTLDDLDDFSGYIAAEANHCDDSKKQKKLDAVFEKVQRLLDTYTDDEPPQTLKIEDARKEKAISDQAVQIAEFAAQALKVAEQLRIKTKPLDKFWLAPSQQEVLLLIPSLPKTIKRFALKYEYDFGDGWEHEVLYEGSPPLEKGKKYPLCLEGERACPPEDIGGVWGYGNFLEAIADPKHEQHHDFVKWAGKFDPDEFDAGKTTKAMRRGLPDWRHHQ